MRENVDQILAKMDPFFAKFYIPSSEKDLIEFQLSGFFRVQVLAILRDQVFSGSALEK